MWVSIFYRDVGMVRLYVNLYCNIVAVYYVYVVISIEMMEW
jgi:hypothetical protein